jgi:hypothetical protein
LRAWEKKHGRVPKGAFAALRTDMYKDWNSDPERFKRTPFPAWSLETVKFLVEQRGVTAIGHESMDTDTTDKMESETYILRKGRYQIEVMANLDHVGDRRGAPTAFMASRRRGVLLLFAIQARAATPRGLPALPALGEAAISRRYRLSQHPSSKKQSHDGRANFFDHQARCDRPQSDGRNQRDDRAGGSADHRAEARTY